LPSGGNQADSGIARRLTPVPAGSERLGLPRLEVVAAARTLRHAKYDVMEVDDGRSPALGRGAMARSAA
jgi:hypothetical protein